MEKTLTSTETARRFGEVLGEVKHARRSFIVTRNGEPVAELRPVDAPQSCTVKEFIRIWCEETTDADDTFADDLQAVQDADRPARNPWE